MEQHQFMINVYYHRELKLATKSQNPVSEFIQFADQHAEVSHPFVDF